MKLFSKKSSKTQPSSHEGDDSIPLPPDAPSPARSPTKSSSRQQQPHGSSSKKPSSTSGGPQTSPSRKEHRPSRSSRTFVRPPTDPAHSSSSSRRSRIDLNTHPLNLPPEERKRLSALSNNMSDPSAMDVDPPTSPPSSSSPPPQPAQPQPQSAFSVPITNGTKKTNGESAAPPVPPHRSNPSSPVPSPEDEADAFKAAGNKYFKEKKYADAIKQYDKGKPSPTCPLQGCRLCPEP